MITVGKGNMNQLNKQAFNETFCDRVADLALAQKSATYRPVFNAAKAVIEPLERNSAKALGEQVFRGSSSPDFWTSLKNMVLSGYGQNREMHGIRDEYLGHGKNLAARIRGVAPGSRRDAMLTELKNLTTQFRADKDQGFTAIGATAKPRMDTMKMIPPALGAAGLAGTGGLWLGNEENQQQMKDLMQNQTLMDRLKYVLFPRHQLRHFFLGNDAAKQSSMTLREASGLPILPALTGLLGGATGVGSRALNPDDMDTARGRGLFNRAFRGAGRGGLTGVGAGAGILGGGVIGSGLGARLMFALEKNPELTGPATLAGSLLGLLAGSATGGAAGGLAGYRLGGIGAKPSPTDRLRIGFNHAKSASRINIFPGLSQPAIPTSDLIGSQVRVANPTEDDVSNKRDTLSRALLGAASGRETSVGAGLGAGFGSLLGAGLGAGAGALMKNPSDNPIPMVVGGGLGGLLGMAGGAGLGAFGGYRASRKLEHLNDKKEKGNKKKAGMEKQAGPGSALLGLGADLLRAGAKVVPPVARFGRNVMETAVRQGIRPITAATRQVGMGVENFARQRGVNAENFINDNLRNPFRTMTGQQPLPVSPQTFIPSTVPSFRHQVKGLGLASGAGIGGLGFAAVPHYGQNVVDTFRHPWDNGAKPIYDMFSTGEGREQFGNSLGLPMSEQGPNAHWHRPSILGGG